MSSMLQTFWMNLASGIWIGKRDEFITNRTQNDRRIFHAGVRDLQREFRAGKGGR